MATFAPQIPERGDPEYLRYSKPIPQPEGDKSGYYLMKGLGDAVEEGVKGLDKTVGHYAENVAYEEGQKAEEAKKAELFPVWQSLTGGAANSGILPPKAMSFLGDTDAGGSLIQKNTDLPPEIRYGTKMAQSLNEKFVNGKLSQTQYDMEVDALAKDLNSRFPAYHQNIAQGLSRATGRANANQTASDMINDINRITGQLNQEKNKIDSHVLPIIKDMDPQSAAEVNYRRFTLKPGQPGYMDDKEVLDRSYKAQAPDVAIQRSRAQFELYEANNKLTKEQAQQNLNESIASIADKHMHAIEATSGKSFDESVAAAQRLRDNPNDQEGLAVVNSMRRIVEGMEADMRKSTVPFSRKLGGDVNKTINEQMAYVKGLVNDMGDPQKAGNAVSAAKSWVDALTRDAQMGFAKSDIGRQAVMYDAMNKVSPAAAKLFEPEFMKVTKDAGPKIGKVFSDWAKQGIAIKPGDPTNKQQTVEQGIEEARKLGANPKTLQGYINFIGNIGNLDNDQARNLAYAYFSPENLGLVSKWAREGFDPRSEGQSTVLNKLGSKVVSDKIYSIGDNKLTQYYKDFMENAFAHTVFPSMLSDTREMSVAAGDKLRYDTDTAHFNLDPRGQGSTSTFVRNTITRLNASIDTMKNIAKHESKDPNEYLIGLIRAGDPEAFSREIPGFPGQINQAIKNQILQKELEKKLKEQTMKNYQEAK